MSYSLKSLPFDLDPDEHVVWSNLEEFDAKTPILPPVVVKVLSQLFNAVVFLIATFNLYRIYQSPDDDLGLKAIDASVLKVIVLVLICVGAFAFLIRSCLSGFNKKKITSDVYYDAVITNGRVILFGGAYTEVPKIIDGQSIIACDLDFHNGGKCLRFTVKDSADQPIFTTFSINDAHTVIVQSFLQKPKPN